MKNLLSILFVFSIVFFFNTCKTKYDFVFGSVEGEVVLGLTDQPLSDIPVVLIDKDFDAETICYNSSGAFLDTCLTDQNGFYRFEELPAGNYAVVPIDRGYEMQNVPNNEFAVRDESMHHVNFEIAPIVSYSTSYNLRVNIINIPASLLPKINKLWTYRREWLWFIPFWDFQHGRSSEDGISNTDYTYTFNPKYGETLIVYTTENYYRLNISELIDEDNDQYRLLKAFEFGTPLHDTPEEVVFQCDWETGVVTRVE